jgi:multimeric flavodoxin WrbA
MKVVAFNGSPRKDGNTSILINTVFAELQKEGIETESVQVGGKQIRGCLGCMMCFRNKDRECSVKNDILNELVAKMAAADGIILGSSDHFGNVSSEMKALIDRAGLVSIANDFLLKRKVGAAVVAVRRAGAVDTCNAINHFFALNQVIIPCSTYWNIAFGLIPGDVKKDQEGMRTMKVLGENMAWLLKKIRGCTHVSQALGA